MKKICLALFIILLFTNCAHRVVRRGYQVQPSENTSCNVTIKKNFSVPDTLATKIGELQLKDSGFSIACSEEDAIQILIKEACTMNANLIVITKEKRPNFTSSCYRCDAEFYTYNSPVAEKIIESDNAYNKEKIKKRTSADRVKNSFYLIGSVFIGLIAGTLAVSLF